MKIEWKSEYSMGIEIIDEQHKMFVNILNLLYESILNSEDREHLSKTFDDLERYADTHFKTEEQFFKEFNYEFEKEHVEEHKKFQQKIADFKKSFQQGEAEISTPLIDFLENWLVHHLASVDAKYVPCFKSHGL